MPSAATSTTSTLNKLGAHLRWLIEKYGVDPETTVVSIGVKTAEERAKLLGGLHREFDAATMGTAPNGCVITHGVPIFVFDNSRLPGVPNGKANQGG